LTAYPRRKRDGWIEDLDVGEDAENVKGGNTSDPDEGGQFKKKLV